MNVARSVQADETLERWPWTDRDQREVTGEGCGVERRSKVLREEERRPEKGCNLGSRSRNIAGIDPMQMGRGEGFKRVPKKVFDEVKEEEKWCNRC